MKEIVRWVARLKEIEAASEASKQGKGAPPAIQEFYCPLLSRGFTPLSFVDSFFAIQPLMGIVQRSGDPAPIAQSLLRVPDSPSPSPFALHPLADELAALMCAALGGWVDVVKAVPFKAEGSESTSFMNTASMTDGSLNRPIGESSTEPLRIWLEKVASLDDPHDEAIGAAIRLHHGAVLLYEHDLRAAYLLLVAGIEILSRQYGEPPTDWGSWEDSKSWDKQMDAVHLTADQRQAIQTKLLADKHLRLKLTFREYASTTLPETFWSKPHPVWNYGHHVQSGMFLPAELFSEKPIEELLTRDRAVLSRSIGKSYDTRSGLVHRGERLSFQSALVAPWNTVDGTKMVPFALLRLILLELISVELERNSNPIDLPDLKWSY